MFSENTFIPDRDHRLETAWMTHSELVFGARITTQVHAYVAGWLTGNVFRGPWIGAWIRAHGRIRVIAGSMVWGGSCPPHLTHQDGHRFDWALDFPPSNGARFATDDRYWAWVNAWPEDAAGSEVPRFVRSLYKDRTYGAETEAKFAELIRTKWPEETASELPPPRDGKSLPAALLVAHESAPGGRTVPVFRELIQQAMRDALAGAAMWLVDKPPSASDRAAEEGFYTGTLRRLADMPRYTDPESERAHQAAHLAIVLSFPLRILWACPLHHVRALWALRLATLDVGLKVFGDAELPSRLQAPTFAFFPVDHHHHWHVEYWLGQSERARMVASSQLDRRLDTPLRRLHRCLGVWAAFGVDLEPLVEQLASYRARLARAPESAARQSTIRELDEVVVLLEAYRPAPDGAARLAIMWSNLATCHANPAGVPGAEWPQRDSHLHVASECTRIFRSKIDSEYRPPPRTPDEGAPAERDLDDDVLDDVETLPSVWD